MAASSNLSKLPHSALRLIFHGTEEKCDTDKQATELQPQLSLSQCAFEQDKCMMRMKLATICGSDLHTLNGKRKMPTPLILGHEGVGELITTVPWQPELCVGDRVTFATTVGCGGCSRCQIGLPQKCVTLFKYSQAPLGAGPGLSGCYASHLEIRPGTRVVKIPGGLPDASVVFLNCAGATAVAAARRLPETLGRESRVWVQGAGLLGLLLCCYIKEKFGCHVVCSDLREDRAARARLFGADDTCADDVEESSLSAVVEVCGSPSVVGGGVRALAPGGVYVLVGMVHPQSRLGVTGEQLIKKCLTLTGVHNYCPEDLETAVTFAATHQDKYPLAAVVGQTFPLQQYAQAFSEAASQKHLRVALSFPQQ